MKTLRYLIGCFIAGTGMSVAMWGMRIGGDDVRKIFRDFLFDKQP